MKKRKYYGIAVATLALFGYAGAYLYFRSGHAEVWEKDSRAYVIFPSRASYWFFRPLSYLDSSVTSMRFHIGPHR